MSAPLQPSLYSPHALNIKAQEPQVDRRESGLRSQAVRFQNPSSGTRPSTHTQSWTWWHWVIILALGRSRRRRQEEATAHHSSQLSQDPVSKIYVESDLEGHLASPSGLLIKTSEYRHTQAYAHTEACTHTCTLTCSHTSIHIHKHMHTHKHTKRHTPQFLPNQKLRIYLIN